MFVCVCLCILYVGVQSAYVCVCLCVCVRLFKSAHVCVCLCVYSFDAILCACIGERTYDACMRAHVVGDRSTTFSPGAKVRASVAPQLGHQKGRPRGQSSLTMPVVRACMPVYTCPTNLKNKHGFQLSTHVEPAEQMRRAQTTPHAQMIPYNPLNSHHLEFHVVKTSLPTPRNHQDFPSNPPRHLVTDKLAGCSPACALAAHWRFARAIGCTGAAQGRLQS